MGRASGIQNSFDGGELSSLLLGRQDLDRYKQGMFVCLNGFPFTQGPWTRRPGTAFLHAAKYNSKVSRVFPFQYSTTQTYVLEFGDLYIRFFTSHGILTNTSQSITAITKANPGVVTKVAHGYSNGDRLQLSSVVGMTQLNNREVKVANKTADTFELQDSDSANINTTNYGTFTSGNMAKIFEVTTTYTEAELAALRITQSADTVYITHPSHKQAILVRTAALTWSLTDIVFTDGPYDAQNTTATTLTPTAATTLKTAITVYANNGTLIRLTAVAHGLLTGDLTLVRDVLVTPGSGLVINGTWLVTKISNDVIDLQGSTYVAGAATGGFVHTTTTLTASSIIGINNNTGWASTDVGRLVRLREGTTWGYCEILLGGSGVAIHPTVVIHSTLTNTNAKTAWRLGVWCPGTGFPQCSAFYEDRLYFAGPTVYPQRFDGSNVSGYTNFSPSAVDGTVSSANAVSGTLNADDVNAIKWMSPHDKGLLIGTTRGEWQIRASTQGEAVTPTNITFRPQTRRGSASVAPVKAGRAVLFLQRAKRKLREMAYVLDVDGFKTPDMAALSEHITSPGIVDLAYQEQPQAIVWAPRSDGVLLGMTYDRDAGVVAWHRHELGGVSNAAGTAVPLVESVAVVVDPTDTRDELYLVVQRYVNGHTVRFIEYMSKIWESTDVQENAFYLDAGWTDLTPATNTISGLWYLEGQTVGVYVDGTKQPNVVVTNGVATLGATGTIKTVGYSYLSDGQTMPLEGGSQDGSAQGKTKRIARLGLWVMDTLGLKFGPDADHLTELLVREWGEAYGAMTPLATGVFRERFEGTHDRLGQVYWRADGPFPANVLALMPQYETADDS